MSTVLNNKNQDSENNSPYGIRYDIQRISDQMFDFNVQLKHFDITHQHLIKTIDQLSKDVNVINNRHLKQDTILALISKVWKISPYIIGLAFLVGVTLSETSFDFSEFIIQLLHKLVR